MFPYIHPRWTVPPGGSAYYTTFQRYANFFSGAELKVRTRIVRTRDGYPINETPWNDPSKPTERSSALHGKIRNTADVAEEFEFQVQLADSEFPLVWHCIGDFVSVRIFEPHQQMPQLGMPYIPLDQPKRRTAQPRKQKHPS